MEVLPILTMMLQQVAHIFHVKAIKQVVPIHFH